MSSEKIALILDTNIFEIGDNSLEDFSTFPLEIYEEANEMIERNYIENLDIFIPEIVLMELASHKLERLKDRLEKLDKINKEFNYVDEIEIMVKEKFLADEHVKSMKESVSKDLNLIRIPKDWSLLFDRILNMSLYKIPPFEKGKGKSDKGFKDAIILLSLINFAKEKAEYAKFVLFSQDKVFKKYQEVIKEFFLNETSKDLEIQGNKDIQGYILNEFEIYIDFQNYLKQYFSKIDESIKEKQNIFLESEGIVCEIENFEINRDNSVIKQVNDFMYDLFVFFNLSYKCKDDDTEKSIDDINKEYNFKKEDNEWLVEEKDFNYKFF